MDTTERLHFHALEKEMATHPSVLAWRIPETEEPGRLLSMRLHRVGHDWSDSAAATTFFFLFFLIYFLISWGLITLQYCSGFCHTLTWISPGYTCIPHPDPPSYLPLHPILMGLPSAPGLSTCLIHATWAGDLFHPR